VFWPFNPALTRQSRYPPIKVWFATVVYEPKVVDHSARPQVPDGRTIALTAELAAD
jgi:hypothetical protein